MEIIIANKTCRTNNQISYNKLKMFLEDNVIADDNSEYDVRMILLPFVEQQLSSNEWILYDGNLVWDVKRLTKQFKTFVKYYDYKHFSKYLYEFFHLQCGSIAHYNKVGWLGTYSDMALLKEFFKSNEYGQEVRTYPPDWHYDAQKAAEAMHAILFGPGKKVPYPHY